jgi:hypothetical protein
MQPFGLDPGRDMVRNCRRNRIWKEVSQMYMRMARTAKTGTENMLIHIANNMQAYSLQRVHHPSRPSSSPVSRH